MPLYEYRCVACNAKEECLTSFSSPTEHDCPVCGKTSGMKRQVSAPAINFSGGGWYAQGYSNSPSCKADKSGGGNSSPSSPSGKGCCDNCPAINK